MDLWIKELEQYNFIQLCAIPSPNGWSLGQMYRHLIEDTKYYIEQIEVCVTSNDHESENASPNARIMFLNNGFPNEALEGSPANAYILQPDKKEQLMIDLLHLKAEMNLVAIRISESPFKGKTKHPGLNYLGANEWLQFADMHFRHHLRQKKELMTFCR